MSETDNLTFDGVELTTTEAFHLRQYTNEGYSHWSWELLYYHEFNPVEYARFYGDDGRTERSIVRSLVAKGLLQGTSTKGVYCFTEAGLRWLFLWRQAQGDYPIPREMKEKGAEENGK